MKFTFVTMFDRKAFTVGNMAIRKVQKRKRGVSVIIGCILMLWGVSLIVNIIRWKQISMGALVFALLFIGVGLYNFFEDTIVGYLSDRQMPAAMKKCTVIFEDERYQAITEASTAEWNYDKIDYLFESEEYFIFIIGKNHFQPYDKSSISGGTVEEFRSFIEGKLQRKFAIIKE